MRCGQYRPGMEFARWMFVFCGAGFWAAIGYKVLDLAGVWVVITTVLLGLALMGVTGVLAPFGQPAAADTPASHRTP